ncbi:replication-relaxation family protein [Priestia megaterium]|uniref:replication-relaxation family protein n=1 Tax=Priestia megaterium TaxID=1404 RepID=UPI00352B4F6C
MQTKTQKPLSPRQENILLSLKKLDFLNREQLQRLHGLGEKRNANRILSTLYSYLSRYREEYTTVYYLNAKGREYVMCEKVRKKGNKVNHTLIRNDFYIFSGCPTEWKNEIRLGDGDKISVVCDSWYKSDGYYNILEVDHLQSMKENRTKVMKYLSLYQSGIFEDKLGYFPPLTWVTTTELRRKQLQEICKDIPSVVYTTTDIK